MFILFLKDLRKYIISFQNGSVISKYNNMLKAAQNGFLTIIQYNHENNTGINWKYAMNLAAENGHLETVKWLLLRAEARPENRKEGCTEWAMNYAVTYGHLHIVNYLKIISQT